MGKAMCHEKNKDEKEMISDILSLEKKALKLKKMREEKVRRDEEPTEARSRLISEKMPKAADEETETCTEEETEDESSTPTLEEAATDPGEVEKTKGANEEDLFVLVQEEDEEEEGRHGSKRSRTANWEQYQRMPPVKPSPMKACK